MSIAFPLSDDQVLAIVDNDGDIDGSDYDALFDYYLNSGEMPYGTAKARDGDPQHWIYCQLEQRARAIRFFTDTSHPSVGDGERVHRSAVALVSRGRGQPAELLMMRRGPGLGKSLHYVPAGFPVDVRLTTQQPTDLADLAASLTAIHDANEDGDGK